MLTQMTDSPIRAVGWLTLAVASATARPAIADDQAFTIGSRPAWIALGGVTTGGTIALGDRGALVGGELSLARLRNASFVGFYSDAYYDWGVHGTYVTGGLEAGHHLVGLDAGVALRFAQRTEGGVAARLTVGIGQVGVYVRYARLSGAMDGETNELQVGLVVKLPLWSGGVR